MYPIRSSTRRKTPTLAFHETLKIASSRENLATSPFNGRVPLLFPRETGDIGFPGGVSLRERKKRRRRREGEKERGWMKRMKREKKGGSRLGPRLFLAVPLSFFSGFPRAKGVDDET